MIAEAYFILTIIFLEGYSLQEGQVVSVDDEDFVKHVKSRIYRDLGTYIRPQTRSKYTKLYQLKSTTLGGDETEAEVALAKVQFEVPMFEVLETIIQDELDMKVFNCYLKNIFDDADVAHHLGVPLWRVAAVRRLLTNRLIDANFLTVP